MNGGPTPLDRAIEVVLTVGLLTSGILLFAGLLLGSAGALRWGVLVLLSTPVARVVVVTAGLLRQKDWLFAAVSLWILAVLASSLYVAMRI